HRSARARRRREHEAIDPRVEIAERAQPLPQFVNPLVVHPLEVVYPHQEPNPLTPAPQVPGWFSERLAATSGGTPRTTTVASGDRLCRRTASRRDPRSRTTPRRAAARRRRR